MPKILYYPFYYYFVIFIFLMGKKVSLEPQSLSCGKWQFAYPIYSVSSAFIKDLDAHIVLVAGGGGKSKTGVPNAFVCYD